VQPFAVDAEAPDLAPLTLVPAGVVVHRLAVREIPRSGQPDELLDRYGISAGHIADAVRKTQLSGVHN